VLVAIGIYVYLDVDADAELRSALAETDRLDPRWRLDDVEADWAVVPDAINSAGPAMAARLLLPKNWPFWDYPSSEQGPPDAVEKHQALQKCFWDLEPQHQLNGPTLPESLLLWNPSFIKSQRSAMLRYTNQTVELAKLPHDKRHFALRMLEATKKDQPLLVRLLAPAQSKVSDACQRTDAQLRCTIVAVAAERYRQAQGRWRGSRP